MLTHKLTKEQQCTALNLAMQIDTGVADYDEILKKFETYPNLATNVITFWYGFNNMTRNAVKLLVYHKRRQHLERCLAKS